MMLRRYWLLGVAVLLAACAAFTPGPRTVTVSEARLAQLIAEQFPLNRRLLEVFDLSLTAPEIRLLPDDNRIATRFRYTLGGLLMGSRRLDGGLHLSYGLRYEPSDASVRLTQVRVEDFDVPGVPAAYAPQARRLGALLAEGLLQDFTLHRLSADDLKGAQGLGYQPGELRVVPGGLQLQLVPVSR